MTDGIDPSAQPSGTGCADCEGADPPGWWVHLRRCAECGHIGCCDTSPARHATAHATSAGHRFIQSFEPDEDWFYDYETGEVLDGPELRRAAVAARGAARARACGPGAPGLDGAHPPLTRPSGSARHRVS